MKTADEIGKKLKISGRYVRKLAERREIPFYRVGPRALRFDEAEVVKAIKYVAASRGIQLETQSPQPSYQKGRECHDP